MHHEMLRFGHWVGIKPRPSAWQVEKPITEQPMPFIITITKHYISFITTFSTLTHGPVNDCLTAVKKKRFYQGMGIKCRFPAW